MKKWHEIFFRTSYPNALKKGMMAAYNVTRDEKQQKHLCHAPFKSMLFANNGSVLACCFNRQAISGRYPQQSLKEIWFSKESELLRNHVSHNDLSYGCFVCKNQLLNKEFNTVKARMFDHLPDDVLGYPVMMEFDLDNTCNLECVMCNADNSSAIRNKSELYEKYTSPYDANFVKELEPFIPHLHQVSFAGGEPFLIKLYYDIWEKMMAINPEIRINITTNATVLNDKIKTILDKGYFEISVSLDTVNEGTYGQIRKNADFKTVMENLLYYRDYCKDKETFFGVWACPLRNNRHEIPELFNYFGALDIEVFLHTVWVPPKVTLWNLSSQELNELYSFYAAQNLKEDTEVQFKNKQRYQEYVSLIKAWEAMAQMREKRASFLNKFTDTESFLAYILEQQHLNKGLKPKDVSLKINACHAKLTYCQTHLPLHIYNEAVTSLSQYPDEFIFQIFEGGTEMMICDFFKFLVN